MCLQRNTRPLLFSLVLLLSFGVARAQGLKTIDNPNGGQLVYGAANGQTTPQGAVAICLRYVHGSFGDRPKVGTIFQAKDGQTFGVSFTLTAVKLGNKPIAGLVMVSMSMGAEPQAAVLYDEKTRFAKTQTEMLHTLSGIWSQQLQQTASAPVSSAPSGQARPLHMVSGGDGSGHIGLPDDWHITAMRGGQCTAEGPHGEMVGLGLQYAGIHDPNLRSNRPAYNNPNAPVLYAPMNGDLFTSFVSVTNQIRASNHLPAGTFTLISAKPSPSQYGENNTLFAYDLDLHDGKGVRSGSAMVAQTRMQGAPTWIMLVQSSSIPKAYAASEGPTVHAIVMSYNQDAGVIRGEQQRQIGNSLAAGARAKQQAADADARRVASSAAFNQHMNDIDIASKNYQNYMFQRTEVQDSTAGTRGAIDNNVAAALIKANPDRYQEVPSSSFLKGVDY